MAPRRPSERTAFALATTLVLAVVVAASGCSSDPEGATLACGHAGEACCDNAGCEPTLRCNAGTCAVPPSDIGLSCTSDLECQEGACVAIAIMEGGERKVCSRPCTTADVCTKGWDCTRVAAGRGVCTCAQSLETCDGKDNDCNGAVDDGAADDACSSTGARQRQCRDGQCGCVTECGGTVDGTPRCVDARTDVENCGACGHRCKGAEICGNGKCACLTETCDGVCTDTQNDSGHCGGCGADHRCEYQCQTGECRPSIVSPRDPDLLGAMKGNVHRDLALDSARIYFVHSRPGDQSSSDRPEQIRACPLAGCTGPADELFPLKDETTITNLMVDGPTIYWWERARVERAPKVIYDHEIKACETASCEASTRTVFDNSYDSSNRDREIENVRRFVLRDGNVYWTSPVGVRTCPASGCVSAGPTKLVEKAGDFISVDEQTVYFTGEPIDETSSTGRTPIFTCPRTGCTSPTLLREEPGVVRGLVAHGGRIYWTARPSDLAFVMISPPIPRVASCVPSDCTNTLVVLAEGEAHVESLAVDDQSLYWMIDLVPLGKVRKCVQPNCVGGPTTLADLQHGPGGIVINATNTFWADLDFQLLRFKR